MCGEIAIDSFPVTLCRYDNCASKNPGFPNPAKSLMTRWDSWFDLHSAVQECILQWSKLNAVSRFELDGISKIDLGFESLSIKNEEDEH